jgi:xylulokinase
VVVLPYHDGERAPRWDSRLRGEIHDLRFRTGPAEVSRAVLEAAAYGLRHIHESLQAEGVSMELMVCAGSPARSELWNSIKASVLEVPVDVPESPEQLSAYGCALAAGAAVGWWDGVGASSMSSWPKLPMTRIEPEPSAAYHEGYARFLEAGDAAVARLSEVDDR